MWREYLPSATRLRARTDSYAIVLRRIAGLSGRGGPTRGRVCRGDAELSGPQQPRRPRETRNRMKSTHAVDDVATHPQPSRVVHYLYSLAQQVMSGFRSARRHLERNGSGAHDRVVLVDGLRPSLWAAKWVQVRHAQMVATKNLESRELAQAGRPRDRHPCLDPRAVGGVLSRVDPASAGYAAVHRQM